MKRMKSMYVRQVAILLGLTFLCLVLLGVGFFTLSYRYQLQEIQTTLDRNAGFISSYADAALTKGGSLTDESFVNYIHSVVLLTDTTVLVCDTDGQVLCAAGSNLNQEAFNTPLQNLYVPNWAVNQLLRGSEYSGMTTFNQLLNSRCYLTSEVLSPLTQGPKDPAGLVPSGMATGFLFVAADATSVSEFLHSTLQLFLITAMVVLLISLIICSITVQRMVEPLKGMCAFAHKFAHGEVDTRVTEYANRDDEIGELAIAFNAMADSLAQAEQKRSEFVANVSHELKTPMTTIAGFADGILDGTIPPENERQYLQIISDESRRLSRLVRRMLDVSQLQAIDPLREGKHFDICESMRRVLISMERKITDRNLDVEADIPEEPILVLGDKDMITQVIYNLLENATKFAREGSTLYLGVTTIDGKARVTVRNEGDTIPAEELPLLFERFHKSDKSRSEDKDGYGLGLYIVKTILEQHKEKISVTSEDGVTAFSFSLATE